MSNKIAGVGMQYGFPGRPPRNDVFHPAATREAVAGGWTHVMGRREWPGVDEDQTAIVTIVKG
jgi:hypothetical protein